MQLYMPYFTSLREAKLRKKLSEMRTCRFLLITDLINKSKYCKAQFLKLSLNIRASATPPDYYLQDSHLTSIVSILDSVTS